jgi:phenylacetate-CoA ligase
VITDLTNYAFPLLRYRLGDQGRLLDHQCSCGLPFPLMDYVRGRISDQIHLPDGASIPGEYWTTIFDDYPQQIKSFRVLQRKDYSIEVSYEPYIADVSSVIDRVHQDLTKRLQNKVAIRFIQATINNNENGKTRFVRSELDGG